MALFHCDCVDSKRNELPASPGPMRKIACRPISEPSFSFDDPMFHSTRPHRCNLLLITTCHHGNAGLPVALTGGVSLTRAQRQCADGIRFVYCRAVSACEKRAGDAEGGTVAALISQ